MSVDIVDDIGGRVTGWFTHLHLIVAKCVATTYDGLRLAPSVKWPWNNFVSLYISQYFMHHSFMMGSKQC